MLAIPINTPVEIKSMQGFTPRRGRIVSQPFTMTRSDGRVVEGNYAVELGEGFYPKDCTDFFVGTVIAHRDNLVRIKFPCVNCGGEREWDTPSGVCSSDCLNQAQGFTCKKASV